jgi:hypothetical protein
MTDPGDCCGLCNKLTKQDDLVSLMCCDINIRLECLFKDSVYISQCPHCKSSDKKFIDSLKPIYITLHSSLLKSIIHYSPQYDTVYNTYMLDEYKYIHNKSILEYCYVRNIIDQLEDLLTPVY